MFESTYIGKNLSRLETSPKLPKYTGVEITVSEDIVFSAGDNSGEVLYLENPWATQAVADNIYSAIKNFEYQPYEAEGAYIDPASELGDAADFGNVYSGIYTQDLNVGPLYQGNISAPGGEEIGHEFTFEPEKERVINRKFKQVASEFKVQAGKIAAKVSTSGGEQKSFGWELDEKSWTLYSKGKTVLQVTENGLEVAGTVKADSGNIGDFQIADGHISTNSCTWEGEDSLGLYIGNEGIKIGDAFKVTNTGQLFATFGTFTGTVYAGSIQAGTTEGYIQGGQYGQIGGSTITTGNTISDINTSLYYADVSNDVFNGTTTAPYIKANALVTESLALPYGGSFKDLYLGQITVGNVTHNVVKWTDGIARGNLNGSDNNSNGQAV